MLSRDLPKYKTDHLIWVSEVFQWVSSACSMDSKSPWLSTAALYSIPTLLTPLLWSTLSHKCLSLAPCGIAGLPTWTAFALAVLSLL